MSYKFPSFFNKRFNVLHPLPSYVLKNQQLKSKYAVVYVIYFSVCSVLKKYKMLLYQGKHLMCVGLGTIPIYKFTEIPSEGKGLWRLHFFLF